MPRRLPLLPTPSFSAPVSRPPVRPKISVTLYCLSLQDVVKHIQQLLKLRGLELFVEVRANDHTRYNVYAKHEDDPYERFTSPIP